MAALSSARATRSKGRCDAVIAKSAKPIGSCRVSRNREIVLIPFDAFSSRRDQLVVDDLICLHLCAAERGMVDQRNIVDPMCDGWRRRGIIEVERTSRCVKARALHDVQNF